MTKKDYKRKGITSNHQDCIKQMDLLYTQLEEKEGDYNNLLLQNRTLQSIVENQAKEISELKLQFDDLIKEKNKYKSFHEEWTRTFDVLGFKGFDDLNNFIYNNQNNNEKYIILENENKKLKQDIEDIKIQNKNIDFQIKIDEALDIQKKEFDEKFHKQELKYNSLHADFINLKKEKINKNIPTPSNSNEIKINKEKIKLPEKLFEVVYYRYVKNKNNNLLPSYIISNNIKYLVCCNKEYRDKQINSVEPVTCTRCYYSYTIAENENPSNCRIIKTILNEYIIKDEKEILKKIKCNNNNCDFTSKKEINLCNSCCKEKQGNDFINNFKIFDKPDIKDNFLNSKLVAAEETYIKLLYLHRLYSVAQKDGIDITNMNEIVEYIKTNKMLEDKQKNIINYKIQRAYSIVLLYNDEKYIPIQDYIKRINFKVNDLARLTHEKWLLFRRFLEDNLDEELKKLNINDNKENNINNNINEINFGEYNRNCKKCLIPVTKEQHDICDKCKNLCIIEDCKNKKAMMFGSQIDFCIKHLPKI